MMYLLDTDVFTLAYFGKSGVRERIGMVRAGQHEVVISIVTRIEVLRGRFDAMLKAAEGAAISRMHELLLASETFLSTFRMLTFDASSVGHFDRLRVDKVARKTDRNDLLIACVALANGATLVTRNTKDYAAVPGLKIDNWAA